MISTEQYVDALSKSKLTANQWRALRAIYKQQGHKCSPSKLAELLGYDDILTANGIFGVIARTIGKNLDEEPDGDAGWSIAYWQADSREWVLLDNFVAALSIIGVGSDVPSSSEPISKNALFLNGVFDSVLQRMIAAERATNDGVTYLQPYKGVVMQMLKKRPPTLEDPVTLYLSTTDDLNHIRYVAQIVDWDDKRNLSTEKKSRVLEHLKKNQSEEVSLLTGSDEIGRKAVNLLAIRNVRTCEPSPPTSVLRKTVDGKPLKPRTQAGNWTEVFDIGDEIYPEGPTEIGNWSREELKASVAAYLDIKGKVQAGETVNKKLVYRLLSEQFGRSEKAYEYRMQNISYVLSLQGREWLTGLKPARNVGVHVAEQIEELLAELERRSFNPAVKFELEVQEAKKIANLTKPAGVETPKTTTSETTQYVRDPNVIAWVLEEANGSCECCQKPAPFQRFDGTPFLEVHHVHQLADRGPDTTGNAVALCPNCHRELHHGANSKQLIEHLYSNVARLIRPTPP